MIQHQIMRRWYAGLDGLTITQHTDDMASITVQNVGHQWTVY